MANLIPIRCYSCGKVTGDKWENYQKMLSEGVSIKDALDKLGLKRYCCRRILMTHIDNFDDVLEYHDYKDRCDKDRWHDEQIVKVDKRKTPRIIYLTGVIKGKVKPKPDTQYERMEKRLNELGLDDQ